MEPQKPHDQSNLKGNEDIIRPENATEVHKLEEKSSNVKKRQKWFNRILKLSSGEEKTKDAPKDQHRSSPSTKVGQSQNNDDSSAHKTAQSSVVSAKTDSATAFYLPKLATTGLSCVAAATLLYPLEKYHHEWCLRRLEPHLPGSTALRSNIALAPFLRLILHEFFATTLGSQLQDEDGSARNSIQLQLQAGALAGTGQALLLAPYEWYRIALPLEPQRGWARVLWEEVRFGGSLFPQERLQRSRWGIGLLCAREVLLNVLFFPSFAHLSATSKGSSSWEMLVTSMACASVCTLVILPLDVWRLHFGYSATRFSYWSGPGGLVAPPWRLLVRGCLGHAALYGPTLGLVTAVYEYT